VVRADAYFNVSGLTHSTSSYIGTEGSVNSDGTVSGNYWMTEYQFNQRGLLEKVTAPTKTTWKAE
jgi:hypothetical protein